MISPDDRFTVFLDLDTPEVERKPAGERPALIYRHGTAKELRDHRQAVAELCKPVDFDVIQLLDLQAGYQLVEARNIPGLASGPITTPAQMSTVLSEPSLNDAAKQSTEERRLSGAQRKNSARQSPSATEASAGDATSNAASA